MPVFRWPLRQHHVRGGVGRRALISSPSRRLAAWPNQRRFYLHEQCWYACKRSLNTQTRWTIWRSAFMWRTKYWVCLWCAKCMWFGNILKNLLRLRDKHWLPFLSKLWKLLEVLVLWIALLTHCVNRISRGLYKEKGWGPLFPHVHFELEKRYVGMKVALHCLKRVNERINCDYCENICNEGAACKNQCEGNHVYSLYRGLLGQLSAGLQKFHLPVPWA